ncbi:MAG: DODA-type extradiol aromatic ring-opening family dioxygenase [Steroidobacteraceae bacterium]
MIDTSMPTLTRQPVLYVTHGGGPCFWMSFPEPFGPHAYDRLKAYFTGLLAGLPARPRAILVVSAHWEEPEVTVSTHPNPPMLYDYYGFPPHTYQLQYPAPGSAELGKHTRELLQAAGITTRVDEQRGFDHGVFVPMLIIDPQAQIPVVMLSMHGDLDPAHHVAIGRALAPLRDEGVLIIGSGSSFHNLRTIFNGSDGASAEFDNWLHETVVESDGKTRNRRLLLWDKAPGARAAHPREDHLIPLMVAAGAAADDVGRASFRDLIAGKAYSCFSFGA